MGAVTPPTQGVALVQCLQMAPPMVPRWVLYCAVSGLRDASERNRPTRRLGASWRWVQHRRQKRGDAIGYSGHKHQKGEKELTIVENHGFVIGPICVKPVNRNDSVILPETLTGLVAFTVEMDIPLVGSALTLDSGFDSIENKNVIQAAGLKPVIYPNRRNTKTPIVIARKFRWFDRELYKERYKVERTFGWQDTYRRLVISYDRKKAIRTGWRNLAYAMVNFRVTFNTT